MNRNVYLTITDLEEAVNLFLDKIGPCRASIKEEWIPVQESRGRILSQPVFARLSSPNHNAAAMDGIMVKGEKTYLATESNPVILERGRDFEYINTGHILRDPYDAVIMIEDVILLEEQEAGLVESRGGKEMLGHEADRVKILLPASPWQHIRPIGEDIVAGEMILPEHHQIRPQDIGALMSGGITSLPVFERIAVGIMPTGSEISDDYQHLEQGKIFDTNSWTFKAIVEEVGCLATRISPVPDEYDTLKNALLDLLKDNHLIVINAGSSAGSKDFTAAIIQELGEVTLHGIAIKPGKPTILGMVQGKPVIGVPGYPGSAYLVFEEVVLPILRSLNHQSEISRIKKKAVLSRRLVSSLKHREYVRVTLGKVGDRLIATPLNRGAGATMTLVKADGMLVIPKNAEGYDAGEEVEIELLEDLKTIESTLVSIGSHDLLMDYIGSMMKGFKLSSTHVGSMGGVMALMRGETHMAPIHLLDEETGEYNRGTINRYLSGKAFLIKGVKREQGLMVAPGNPKGIRDLKDLTRKDVLFVNRQRGSGTRVLTDYLLKKENLNSADIQGYDRDMTTHMAVAAAVASGTADTGIGVYSAAKAMGLDFIPIGFEDYDFAVAEELRGSPMIRSFVQVLESREFEALLKELGGYERTI